MRTTIAAHICRLRLKNSVRTGWGTPAPYQVITTLYFGDAAALEGALRSAEGEAVVADIAKFYDGMPDVMIGEITD